MNILGILGQRTWTDDVFSGCRRKSIMKMRTGTLVLERDDTPSFLTQKMAHE